MKRIEMEVSGGCQCGAVRYHATAMLDNSHLCHCRMCQKASGNIFAALVAAPDDALTWTRGKPSVWKSSELVERGFCANCGTPLFYENVNGGHLNFTTGSLDHPELFPPHVHCGIEGRVPWFETLPAMEWLGTTEIEMSDLAPDIRATNRQHPDHDTGQWP